MRGRKHTAWRKNRKLGQLHGGRTSLRFADNTFRRVHSLKPPGPGQPTPIVIEDNPSRDHFFPLSAAECLSILQALPDEDRRGLTHLWLRRPGGAAYRRWQPFARYACGSGVRLIELYAWRNDRRLLLGREPPGEPVKRRWARFGGELVRDRGWHYVEFEPEALRRFCVHVLCHEVGHHVDWYRRHWSPPSHKRAEEAAEQYAFRFTALGVQLLRGDDTDGEEVLR